MIRSWSLFSVFAMRTRIRKMNSAADLERSAASLVDDRRSQRLAVETIDECLSHVRLSLPYCIVQHPVQNESTSCRSICLATRIAEFANFVCLFVLHDKQYYRYLVSINFNYPYIYSYSYVSLQVSNIMKINNNEEDVIGNVFVYLWIFMKL
jgi:hypothetical protein